MSTQIVKSTLRPDAYPRALTDMAAELRRMKPSRSVVIGLHAVATVMLMDNMARAGATEMYRAAIIPAGCSCHPEAEEPSMNCSLHGSC